MLYLKSERDGTLLHLLPGKTLKINRKGGDLVLSDDMSISRRHSAILAAQEGEIFLWDEGSKYGTFILNDGAEKKLPDEERTKIQVGDRVRFGVQWNVYKLCKTDFVVCTSTITHEDKESLQRILLKIGGRFKSNWDDECTHLTMNQVSLTHKVVFALADGKPIVALSFWQKMEEAYTNHSEWPKIEDYQPSIQEEELQKQTKSDTLLPSPDRKNLFKGKIFVFSTEDNKNKLKPLVECAGGVCKSIQNSKLSPKQCCESNHVILRDSGANGRPMREIFSTLKQNGLRGVEVSEIGLAIYNNAVIRYCNPTWRKPVILGQSPSQSQGICLVENTEDILKDNQDVEAKPNISLVIPQSLDSNTSVDSSRSVKRPPSPTDTRPKKRPNQKQNSLHNCLQRTETDATASLDTATDDMFASLRNQNPPDMIGEPSPKKSNGAKREESRSKKSEDKDPFKLPFLNKSNELKNKEHVKVPSPKKRGRDENDLLEMPAPKKSTQADRSVDPFDETIEDHSEEELEESQKEAATIQEDSYDEVSIHTPRKQNARRIGDEEGKRATTIEEDSDDEFGIPAPRKKSARGIGGEERKRATTIQDDSDDEFHILASGKNAEERRRAATIEEFQIPASGRGNARKVAQESSSSKTVAANKPAFHERPTASTSNRPIQPMGSKDSFKSNTTSGSVCSNLSKTTNSLPAPSLNQFIDKSTSVVIKKEDSMNEEEEEELSKYLNKIIIVETSLMRQRPPPRVEENSSTVVGGRPNFKKFKKATRGIPRRITTHLILDQSMRQYTGVPEPDADVPADREPRRREPRRREPETEDSQELFPSTNRPIPQNRSTRRQNQIVDEWTV